MIIKTDLRETAMTVALNISCWSARKFDKAVTKRIHEDFGVDGKEAGRFNKLLVEKAAIKAIETARNNCYTFHYANTLPWGKGITILKATNYENYATRMAELEEAYWAEVETFLARYSRLIEAAKDRLNGMFNANDYPHPEVIRDKFRFNVSYQPLAGSDDWRVNLSAKQVQDLAVKTAERERELLASSMKEAWQRLYDVIKHAVEKLGKADAIFRDSLIGNVVKQCEILPMLNLEDDPDLEKMRKAVLNSVGKLDPAMLREDPEGRKRAAKEAKSLMKKMDGYF